MIGGKILEKRRRLGPELSGHGTSSSVNPRIDRAVSHVVIKPVPFRQIRVGTRPAVPAFHDRPEGPSALLSQMAPDTMPI